MKPNLKIIENYSNTLAEIKAPSLLQNMKAWVVWRYEENTDNPDKPKKVPYYAGSGHKRSKTQNCPEDLQKLTTFSEAQSYYMRGGYSGIGLALRDDLGIVALDFDSCVLDGQIDAEVAKLISNTYAEFSPSKTGIRAFMRGKLQNRKSRKNLDKGYHFGFETFCHNGFVTITGDTTPLCNMLGLNEVITNITPEIEDLFNSRFGDSASNNVSYSPENSFVREIALKDVTEETIKNIRDAALSLPEDYVEEYDEWIKVGKALKSLDQAGYGDEAADIWHEFSAKSDRYNDLEAEEKWKTFRPTKITYKSIFTWAQNNGWINPNSSLGIKLGDDENYFKLEDRTDAGNANKLLSLTDNNLIYVAERNVWLWWDGSRWIVDESKVYATSAALRVAKTYHEKTASLVKKTKDKDLAKQEISEINKAVKSLESWANICRSKRSIDNMLALAQRNPTILISASELDRDPWLFGVDNGVLDLKIGKLRDAARDDKVTKRSPFAYDEKAKAPLWEKFIEQICGKPIEPEIDPSTGKAKAETIGLYKRRVELEHYLQKLAGYCITGSTREHKMFIAYGGGSNGKNVFFDQLQEIMGSYSCTMPVEAMMASRFDNDADKASPNAARLAGIRFAISSEAKDGQKINVGLVKKQTGDATMTARFLNENAFQFEITHKLVLMTNYAPMLDHLDDAIRGRLHIIPFDRQWNRPGHPQRDEKLPDGDKNLKSKLRTEATGILAWMVEGAKRYFDEGLNPPDIVTAKTTEYFDEQDLVGEWIKEKTRCSIKEGMTANELFKDYEKWVESKEFDHRSGPVGVRSFGKALKQRGVASDRENQGVRYGLK
jgi:putative DNA primase/helicase